jgi:hypothetical protein
MWMVAHTKLTLLVCLFAESLLRHISCVAVKGKEFPAALLHEKTPSSKTLCNAVVSAPKFGNNLLNIAADTIKCHHSIIFKFEPVYLQDMEAVSDNKSMTSKMQHGLTPQIDFAAPKCDQPSMDVSYVV